MDNMALKTKNLSKEYTVGEQKVQALKNINLSIKEGSFVALTGTSGSGKSTLIQHLYSYIRRSVYPRCEFMPLQRETAGKDPERKNRVCFSKFFPARGIERKREYCTANFAFRQQSR